jgi:uncharacterized membrane protein YkoI
MKTSDKDKLVEERLRRAIKAETPDVLPRVLHSLNTQSGRAKGGEVLHLPAQKKKKSPRRWIGAVAALLVLVVGLGVGYGYMMPVSVIGFDVNPSIELRVNRAEKVLSATALNEDAATVIGDMDFRQVDLDIAVNALIGSMVKNGFLSEVKNSILISVDSTDTTRGAALQQRLSSEVNSLLDAYAVEGAVLSQTVSEDTRLKELAQEHGISLGKAALVDHLVSQDGAMLYSDVAALPINDINLLIASRQAALQGVATSGKASSGAYIGEEAAKAIALEHAGVSAVSLIACRVEMDVEDGVLVYSVEFFDDTAEYDVEVNAITGAILQFERESRQGSWQKPTNQPATSQPATSQPATSQPATSQPATSQSAASQPVTSQPATSQPTTSPAQDALIGADEATAIALSHAGLTRDAVGRVGVDLDYDDGRRIYEIEFFYDRLSYEYEVDAVTGEILWWEAERD